MALTQSSQRKWVPCVPPEDHRPLRWGQAVCWEKGACQGRPPQCEQSSVLARAAAGLLGVGGGCGHGLIPTADVPHRGRRGLLSAWWAWCSFSPHPPEAGAVSPDCKASRTRNRNLDLSASRTPCPQPQCCESGTGNPKCFLLVGSVWTTVSEATPLT